MCEVSENIPLSAVTDKVVSQRLVQDNALAGGDLCDTVLQQMRQRHGAAIRGSAALNGVSGFISWCADEVCVWSSAGDLLEYHKVWYETATELAFNLGGNRMLYLQHVHGEGWVAVGWPVS